MDYYKRYQEIVADYNREKDRTTIEATFAQLVELVESLDEEQQRAAKEGLSEEELALFDLLQRDKLSHSAREQVKQASRELLTSLQSLLSRYERWAEKEQTRAEIEIFILDNLYEKLPSPPFTENDKQEAAQIAYQHIWRQSASQMFQDRIC
jgi:type I restriction enzyme R subunit